MCKVGKFCIFCVISAKLNGDMQLQKVNGSDILILLLQEMDTMLSDHVMSLHAGRKKFVIFHITQLSICVIKFISF